MTAAWPAGVPHKARKGSLRVLPFRDPNKTDMEDGLSRQRPAGTLDIATVSFSIRMGLDAVEDFEAFVRLTLNRGTLPFTMLVWTGADYEEKTCAFAERYQLSDLNWPFQNVALVLDVEDY